VAKKSWLGNDSSNTWWSDTGGSRGMCLISCIHCKNNNGKSFWFPFKGQNGGRCQNMSKLEWGKMIIIMNILLNS